MFLHFIIFTFAVTFVGGSPQNFIINGTIAEARALSFASIVHSEILSGGHIITNRHILTAGHVVDDSTFWIVGVGSNKVAELDWILASGSILHPNYNSNSRANDIGILILIRSLVYSDAIQPIELPEVGLPLPHINEQGHIYGFGWTSSSSPEFNTELKITFQRVISPVVCASYYPINSDSQFCAGDSIDLTNICKGDLGGGFLTFKRSVPVLVGIASMTVELCSTLYPVAYTRVSHYRAWIKEVVDI